MRRALSVATALLVLGVPFAAFAQATSTVTDLDNPNAGLAGQAASAIPQGLSSCFTYYTFGSTPVSLAPGLGAVAAGAPIGFKGTITNNDPYPIVNASIWIKIFRQRSTSGDKDPNGPDVVDWFKAVGPITLQPGQSMPVSFSWQVPRNAESGSYEAATYVASSDRFNLYGLTFTDDVTGSLTPFNVVLGQPGTVGFDKTSVTVDSQPFFFAAYPPNVSATSSIPVSASVVNSTNASSQATITWDLYSWDAVTPGTLLDQKTQTLTIAAHATTSVSYTATDTTHSTYYLVGTLQNGTSKSIIGVRFVREGIDIPRLNFAAVTNYPLTSSSTVFTCAHDTGNAVASSSMLTVQIVPTDPVERFVDMVLGKTTALSYSGVIPGQEVALAGPARATPTSFNLVTTLYQNGSQIDQVSIPYMCTALGASCGYSYTEIAIVVIIVLAVLIVIGLFLLMRRRTQALVPPRPPTQSL